jgi:serine/threonine protein kinase
LWAVWSPARLRGFPIAGILINGKFSTSPARNGVAKNAGPGWMPGDLRNVPIFFGRRRRKREDPFRGYQQLARLGRGNFGEVWRVRDRHGREWALKIIDLTRETGIQEFKGLQNVKKIRQPNLNPIHDYWFLDGDDNVIPEDSPDLAQPSVQAELSQAARLIVVMQLGDKSLKKRLEECEPEGVPWKELLDYIEDAARALDFLHEAKHELGTGKRRIIHCDIKPANILIVGNAAQVCDFGLARAVGVLQQTQTATVGGTFAYMAPEVFRGGKPQPKSDQYSLAVSYFELRTGGKFPYTCRGDELTYEDLFHAHTDGALDLSKLTRPDERAVIEKATRREPDNRYPTCREMAAALREVHRKWREEHEQAKKGIVDKVGRCQFDQAAAALEAYMRELPADQQHDGRELLQSVLHQWEAKLKEFLDQGRHAEAVGMLEVSTGPPELLHNKEKLWDEFLQSLKDQVGRRIEDGRFKLSLRDLQGVENDTATVLGKVPPGLTRALDELRAMVRQQWLARARHYWPASPRRTNIACAQLLGSFPDDTEARLLRGRALVRLGNLREAGIAMEGLPDTLPEPHGPLYQALRLIVGSRLEPNPEESQLWERARRACETITLAAATPSFWVPDAQELKEVREVHDSAIRSLMGFVPAHVEGGRFESARKTLRAAQGAFSQQRIKGDVEQWLTVVELHDPETGVEETEHALSAAEELLRPSSPLSDDDRVRLCSALAHVALKRHRDQVLAGELDRALDLVRASQAREAGAWLTRLWKRRVAIRVMEDRLPSHAEVSQLDEDWHRAENAGGRDDLVDVWRAECMLNRGGDLRRACELVETAGNVGEDKLPYLRFVRALALSKQDRPDWQRIRAQLPQALFESRSRIPPALQVQNRHERGRQLAFSCVQALVLEQLEARQFEAARRIVDSTWEAFAEQDAGTGREWLSALIELRDPRAGAAQVGHALAAAERLLEPDSLLSDSQRESLCSALADVALKEHADPVLAGELDQAIRLVRSAHAAQLGTWLGRLWSRRIAIRVMEDRPPNTPEFDQFEQDWGRAQGAGHEDPLVDVWRAECLARLGGDAGKADKLTETVGEVAEERLPYVQYVRALALSRQDPQPWHKIRQHLPEAFFQQGREIPAVLAVQDRHRKGCELAASWSLAVEVPKYVEAGDFESARNVLERLRAVFGPGYSDAQHDLETVTVELRDRGAEPEKVDNALTLAPRFPALRLGSTISVHRFGRSRQ